MTLLINLTNTDVFTDGTDILRKVLIHVNLDSTNKLRKELTHFTDGTKKLREVLTSVEKY